MVDLYGVGCSLGKEYQIFFAKSTTRFLLNIVFPTKLKFITIRNF
jgi:hypothetical protein